MASAAREITFVIPGEAQPAGAAVSRGRGAGTGTVKASVRAKLRVLVKRILRKHGYPPGKQEEATRTVLEQAELFSEQWMAS